MWLDPYFVRNVRLEKQIKSIFLNVILNESKSTILVCFNGFATILPPLIIVLCLFKNVHFCATHIPNSREVSQIGIVLRMSFGSSTVVTVVRFHGISCLFVRL